jgi:hypothetical protein
VTMDGKFPMLENLDIDPLNRLDRIRDRCDSKVFKTYPTIVRYSLEENSLSKSRNKEFI